MCIQEEERLKFEQPDGAHVAITGPSKGKGKGKGKGKKFGKGSVQGNKSASVSKTDKASSLGTKGSFGPSYTGSELSTNHGILFSSHTRITNQLGAGNPEAARVAVWAVMLPAMVEVIIASTTLLCCRSVLGYAFDDEKEVVDYVKEITPPICLLLIMDSLQAVLSGYHLTSSSCSISFKD
ncbi:hypothetical protein RJ639_030972 [Escallonia herrerae]|uniref:Uncharacterized protein n=1 Tax=Escallonia herrerae TaxID=1293975 RepID=A0AA88WYD4_9ASTE|nr:hypothetical protein RJ639_030972 [Escallonia herrerae]